MLRPPPCGSYYYDLGSDFPTTTNNNDDDDSSISRVIMDGGGGSSLTMPMMAGAEEARTCKSHSEAERRRRQRINGHLATLRHLLPYTAQMDKASLLTEVVRRVRELRRCAADVAESAAAGNGWDPMIPCEEDEVRLESLDWKDNDEQPGAAAAAASMGGGGGGLVRAFICCADRPGLMRDLDRALRSVRVQPVRSEMATLGGRTRAMLLVETRFGGKVGGGEGRSALLAALQSVVENPTGSVSGNVGFVGVGNKRMRATTTHRPFGGTAY